MWSQLKNRCVREAEWIDPIEVADPEYLLRLQWRRIKRVLHYAYDNLSFYRERFDSIGLHPADVKNLDDFSRIPLLSKLDLIAETKSRQSFSIGIEAFNKRPPFNVVMTSGTHGFHTFAAVGRAELTRGAMRAVLREFWMQKIRPGMSVMTLSPAWHFLSLLDSRALTAIGARCVSPFGTHTPRFAERFLDAVVNLRPEYVLTIPPVLYAMLSVCERRGIEPREAFASVRYVSAVGEAVTPRLRQKLRDQLGLDDFFERGGSSDGLWGGGECSRHNGHHVFADLFYVEIVDPVTNQRLGPGERGTIVVTNLVLGKSLYIRFNCEDLGSIATDVCECGRTHPRVEIFDRLDNQIQVNGREITVYDIRACLDEIDQLCGRSFFVVKQRNGGFRIDVYDPDDTLHNVSSEARAALLKRFGLDAEFRGIRSMPARWKGRLVDERQVAIGEGYPGE